MILVWQQEQETEINIKLFFRRHYFDISSQSLKFLLLWINNDPRPIHDYNILKSIDPSRLKF